jgi:hypothetical protein
MKAADNNSRIKLNRTIDFKIDNKDQPRMALSIQAGQNQH